MSWKLRTVRPRTLRVGLLVVIGLPLISGYPVNNIAQAWGPTGQFLGWLSYAAVINALLCVEAGIDAWWPVFAFATFAAVAMASLGVIYDLGSHLVASLLVSGYAVPMGHSHTSHSVHQFTLLLSVLPYGMLVARSFPPAELVRSERDRGGQSTRLRRSALVLFRMVTHVIDVVVTVVPLWREEMPSLTTPRHSRSSRGRLRRTHSVLLVIALTLLAAALEPIPLFARELAILAEE